MVTVDSTSAHAVGTTTVPPTEPDAAKAVSAPMSSEHIDSGSLLGRYRNAGEIFDDQVLAKPTGEVFHRLDPDIDDPHPACHSAPDEDQAQLTSPEAVHQAGLEPCRTCYQAIFEYLGTRPESPVEPRNAIGPDTNLEKEATDFEPIQPDPKPPRLSTLTEEVLVRGGSSKVMPAPTEDGPLCGQAGEYRRVEPEVFAGHYRPCEDCFAVVTD